MSKPSIRYYQVQYRIFQTFSCLYSLYNINRLDLRYYYIAHYTIFYYKSNLLIKVFIVLIVAN